MLEDERTGSRERKTRPRPPALDVGSNEADAGNEGLSDSVSGEPEPGLNSREMLRDPVACIWDLTMPLPEDKYFSLTAFSSVVVFFCAYLMVDSADRIGCILRIDRLVMGMVFVAAGTSIPNALSAMAVAKRGQVEAGTAVCNALNTSIFDILVGLGLPWTLKGMAGESVEFKGMYGDILGDITILILVLCLFFSYMIYNRRYLTRRLGMALLFLYAVYVSCDLFLPRSPFSRIVVMIMSSGMCAALAFRTDKEAAMKEVEDDGLQRKAIHEQMLEAAKARAKAKTESDERERAEAEAMAGVHGGGAADEMA